MNLRTQMPLGVTAVMLPELDFDEQVALCKQLNITHYVYRPRVVPDNQKNDAYTNWGNHKFDLTPDKLVEQGAELRKKLQAAGLQGYCTVARLNADETDDMLTVHLRGAAAGGCQSIRIGPPAYPSDKLFDFPAYLEQAIGHYRRCCDLAEPYGLKVVIEMHAGNSAASPGLARHIVESFDPSELGVILDLPNFVREGFVQPTLTVSVLGKWVDHVHLGGNRQVAGEYDELGFRKPGTQMCPLTETGLYVPAWIDAIAQLEREVPLIIEDYTPALPGALRLRNTADAITRLLDSKSA
ncbi:sugar phosphate isomerase/epimerase family protein [Phycisphaerales bacterium AB-hyl4]|uniref:Sugar phosphate isomerase/epimerase family protein n=1 Tax=Natronomicrosphaera hydrolytica TaxID=3242702 RepID=A0ABV4U728_9BACT